MNLTKRSASDAPGAGGAGVTTSVSETAAEIPGQYRKVAKPPPIQTFTQKRNNAAVAVALLTFVGGVYYTAINKMRPELDELDRVIAEENLKQGRV